jgi:hypothetical protein
VSINYSVASELLAVVETAAYERGADPAALLCRPIDVRRTLG